MPLTEVPPPKIPDKKPKPKVRSKPKDSVHQQIRRATEKAEKLRRELAKTEKTIEAAESVKDVLTGKAPAIVTADVLEQVAPTAREAAIKDENIIFRPNPGPQTDFLAATEDEVFYGGARGGGKASWVEAKIATPFGFRRMGDLKVGDRLCAVDGGVTKVMAVHPQGVVDLFKVTTDDGGETVVTADHMWLVSVVGAKKRKKMTTSMLMARLADGDHINIPVAEAVCWVKNGRYPVRTLDPYLLGLLIGDGCLRGVLQITDEYLHGSVSERLALVQGLMDTDGTVDVEGRVSYCSSSPQLAKDMQFLVRSLGGKATVCYKAGVNSYIVYISCDKPMFRLQRKLQRQNLEKHVWRAIRSIEPFGRGEAQCITVDHASSLYIADDFIVTHNSYAMLADPIRECGRAAHRGLILRRTMPELRDMIHKSQLLYPKAYPGAKWKEQDKEWRFPSGARMEFGYAENLADALRYQGQSYTWIGVDELPQYPTPDVWNFLRSSLRSVDPDIKPVMRASGNPGNVGSGWVRDLFIDPAPPNTRFTVEVTFQTPTGPRKKKISRRYIPARVWDNPYLTYDDSYIAVLASLPETQRKQFLEGNWDVFEGAAFPEFDRNVHVIAPYDIPSNFPRFRAADWGYSSPACCLWFAVDWDNNLIVYRELYGKGRTADVFAKTVMEMEKDDRVPYGILDASTWANRGDIGPSIAETMNRVGCRWRPSDRSPRSRISGKLEVHRRLAVDEITKKPRLLIFNNCLNLIRTLATLPVDKNNAEDVDTKAEDHAYDALRYGCQSRPMFGRMTQHSAAEPEPAPADSEFGY